MSNNIHKGSELRNVKETWDENERQGARNDPEKSKEGMEDTSINKEMQQHIASEAREYDNTSKEEQLLKGDRASVRDEEDRED